MATFADYLSGTTSLGLKKIPEGVVSNQGGTYMAFTDPASGKKYYYKAPSSSVADELQAALNPLGISDIKSQLALNPTEYAKSSGFLAPRSAYNSGQGTAFDDTAYEEAARAWAARSAPQYLDLPNWGTDITNLLKTSYTGTENMPTQLEPQTAAYWAAVNAGQTPPTTTPTPQVSGSIVGGTTPPSTYTGVSIVDYLKSVGQPSDYASRAALAASKGIPWETIKQQAIANMKGTNSEAPLNDIIGQLEAGGSIPSNWIENIFPENLDTLIKRQVGPTAWSYSLTPLPPVDLGPPNASEIARAVARGDTSVTAGGVTVPVTPTAPAITPQVSASLTTPTTPPSNYTGVSIVDYLKSVGKPSDYASRAALAASKGITNYTGSNEQNTQLLNALKGGATGGTVPTGGTYINEITQQSIPIGTASQGYNADGTKIGSTVGGGATGGTTGVTGGLTGGTPDATEIQNKITDVQNQIAVLEAMKEKVGAAGTGADINPLTGEITGGTTGGAGGGAGTTGTTLDTQAIIDAINKALGTSSTSGTDYRTQMTDLITKLQTQQEQYLTVLKGMATPQDIYTKYREQLGIPGKETALAGLQSQIVTTQGLLDTLEDDINSRIQSMTGVQMTEAQRRGLLASKQTPLTKQLGSLGLAAQAEQAMLSPLQQQLTTLTGLAGTEQERAAALAKAPMDYTAQILPTMSEIAQYQSPQEKLAQQLAQEQLYKSLGLGSYATEPTKYQPIGTAEAGYYSFNPTTGAVERITEPLTTGKTYPSGIVGEYQFYSDQEKASGKTPMSFDAYQTVDANRKAMISAAQNPQGFTTKDVINLETGLRKEFNALPVVKQFNTILNAYQQINTAYNQAIASGTNKTTKAAADQVLIVAFNKMIDPNSVVREGEYARTTQGQSYINQLYGKVQAALAGGSGLVDSDRFAVKNMVDMLYKDFLNMYNLSANEYRGYVSDFGGNADKIAKSIAGTTGGTSTGSGGGYNLEGGWE